MKRSRILLSGTILVSAMLSGGCAGMIDYAVNPYEYKVSCPNFQNGKCVSVDKAYNESISGKNGTELGLPAEETSAPARAEKGQSESEYQKALYGKYAKMLKQPETPLLVPAQVMRILLLPYEGDSSELYSSRYVYIKIDDSKWLLGDGIVAEPE